MGSLAREAVFRYALCPLADVLSAAKILSLFDANWDEGPCGGIRHADSNRGSRLC